GDWWVIGPVIITGISPAQRVAIPEEDNHNGDNHWGDAGLQDNKTVRNGSVVVNVLRGSKQGFDSRGKGFDTSLPITLPYTLAKNTSIVSSKSNDTIPQKVMYHSIIWDSEKDQSSAIKTISILTSLSEVPPADAFRPTYVGNDKRIFKLSDVDFDILLDLTPTASMPNWTQFERYFERPWMNHFDGIWLGQELFPTNMNQPYYGREFARIIGQASLMLNTNATDAQKQKLLIGMLQLGIDLRGIAEMGGNWMQGGGLTSGRKWPILFAYFMFDDPYFKDMPYTAIFHEDTETYYGKGWAGQAALWQILVHHGERQPYMHITPDKWATWDVQNGIAWGTHSENYRLCCNTDAWVGQTLSALLMGGKEVWNHNAYFDNVEDWMRMTDLYASNRGTGYPRPSQEGKASNNGYDTFVNEMWSSYRSHVPVQANGTKNELRSPYGYWLPNNIIVNIKQKSVTEGDTLSFNIETAVSSNVAILTISSDNLPSFCTLVDNGMGTAIITIKPSIGDAGEYTINLKATSLSFTENNVSFALTVEETVGIFDESTYQKPKINIYPNPNRGDQLLIQINNNIEVQSAKLSIMDISGREVFKKQVTINKNENLLQLNINRLNKGVYFIVIKTERWADQIKFIVE
ncbi:MAG: T9SS type A sorting domain-containing protein, partial [Bacteroidales bacterium]|nr:T9SS type A sorting domain-containing protein [Bacteroidales bacterium]